jgi:hypothetical protein
MNEKIEKEFKDSFNYSHLDGVIRRGDRIVGTKDIRGYLKFTFKGTEYLAHRVCWFLHNGYWPKIIDHINHDKQDNRIENLRDVDSKANNMNQSLRASNKIGLSGVYWCKEKRKWRAQIRDNGKKKSLGTFNNLFDAAAIAIKSRGIYGYHENHGSS